MRPSVSSTAKRPWPVITGDLDHAAGPAAGSITTIGPIPSTTRPRPTRRGFERGRRQPLRRRYFRRPQLRQMPISDAELGQLRKFSRLQTLRLERTQITCWGEARCRDEPTGGTESHHHKGLRRGIGQPARPDSPQFAGPARTKVTDAGMASLEPLRRLASLDLSCTEIGDEGLTHLRGLTELETLDLSNTKITDAGLVHLEGCGG